MREVYSALKAIDWACACLEVTETPCPGRVIDALWHLAEARRALVTLGDIRATSEADTASTPIEVSPNAKQEGNEL